MTTATNLDTRFFGHPRGLATLFFTEMWERFSYYGMRAILVLYMVAPAATGGLGFSTARAATIYGLYTGSVYAMSIPGGIIADRWLGARLAVLVGGLLIAAGNAMLAAGSESLFFAGLVTVVAGTGMLKPNVASIVGQLYGPQDQRRDAGYSIFYMGINIGAIAAPLLCGTLAQRINWHLGFAAASALMILGLVQFLAFRQTLAHVGNRRPPAAAKTEVAAAGPEDHYGQRILAIGILFIFSTVFWMSFEQAGSSLNLFADQVTRNTLLGFDFPSTWFQSLEPIVVVAFAPLLSWLWLRLGSRQPSSPAKFTYGLVGAFVAFAIITYASTLTVGGKVSPIWLVLVYFFQGIGELLLGPVGLSTTNKLAPPKMAGLMMGVFYMSISAGNTFAGLVARYFKPDPDALFTLFGSVAAVTLISAIALAAMIPYIRRLMGSVH